MDKSETHEKKQKENPPSLHYEALSLFRTKLKLKPLLELRPSMFPFQKPETMKNR